MSNKWLIMIILSLFILIAIILSYEGVKNIKTDIVAKMECHGRVVSLILENNGGPCRLYYLTLTEGDEIISVIELNRILSTGETTLKLEIPNDKLKVSIVFDRGVIGGLTCGSTARSQP